MKRFLATTAIVTFAAMPIYAQTTSTTTMGGTTAMAPSSDAMANPMFQSGSMSINASDLLGMNVYILRNGAYVDVPGLEVTDVYDDWDDVGEIADIVLGADGMIKGVTMDIGGFLGMGENVVSTTMDELNFVADADDEGEFFVVFNGDRSLLEERDAFDQSAANMGGDRMLRETYGNGMQRAPADAAVVPLRNDNMGTAMNDRIRLNRERLGTFTAEEMEGMDVYGSDGEEVGEVNTIVLTQDGMVESVIIDVGGFLGLGEKQVAVSMDRLLTDNDTTTGMIRLSVDYTEEELEGMETWEQM
jgi:sporulation protein YlmC with PRC-barrel domain